LFQDHEHGGKDHEHLDERLGEGRQRLEFTTRLLRPPTRSATSSRCTACGEPIHSSGLEVVQDLTKLLDELGRLPCHLSTVRTRFPHTHQPDGV
jgi:hypothetical protein